MSYLRHEKVGPSGGRSSAATADAGPGVAARDPRGGGCPRRNETSRLRAFLSSKSSSRDRKSTRLNSSHLVISYAVFCLKKKKKQRKLSTKSLSGKRSRQHTATYTITVRIYFHLLGSHLRELLSVLPLN